MTTAAKLIDEYKKIVPSLSKLYVVPKIDFTSTDTDYIFQLYKDIILKESIENIAFESLSVYAHPKFFWRRLLGEKNIVHYHWFECKDIKSLFGIFWKIKWLFFYKLIGGKIIWTIHNKYPHTKKYIKLNRYLRKQLARISNKLHVHCESCIEELSEILNCDKEKFFVAEHPNFPVTVQDTEIARQYLQEKFQIHLPGEKIKLFLMFGNIAEYKGILECINIFKSLPPEKCLVIAGGVKKGDEDYFDEISQVSKGIQNIFVLNKIIPEKEIPFLISAADYMLFNFKEILTSGSVYMGLSYKKPIIIPNLGCLKEIKGEGIYNFDAEENGVNNLKDILNNL